MKHLIALACAAMSLATAPSLAAESLTPEKSADIRKLMEATGALRIGQMVTQSAIGQISQALKTARPDLPDEAFTIVSEVSTKVVSEEMTAKGGYIEQMLPVFNKYLTHDEIRGLIGFYSTPLGKKAISVMPMMAQEGMQIGQRWAQSIAPKLDQRLKARFAERGIKIEPPARQGGAPAPAPSPATTAPAK